MCHNRFLFFYQALGVPTGPHGAFRDFQVDAITMEISPKFSSSHRIMFLLRVGRSVKTAVKCYFFKFS